MKRQEAGPPLHRLSPYCDSVPSIYSTYHEGQEHLASEGERDHRGIIVFSQVHHNL
jgi:hypothetical protein